MQSLTFRLKLLLAMSAAVVVVSVATLFVSQKRVEANYQKMFRRQFENQIQFFTTIQETRLSDVQADCLKLCQSTRVVAALEEGLEATNTDPAILYDNGTDELRRVLGLFQEPHKTSRSTSGRLPATDFVFLDAEGKPILPPANFQNQFNSHLSADTLVANLSHLRSVLSSPEQQQIGYLAVAPPVRLQNAASPVTPVSGDQPPVSETNSILTTPLQEVIVTKVIDPQKNLLLGAMVVFFPLPELLPNPTANSAAENHPHDLLTGILVGDYIYANPLQLPAAMNKDLTVLVKQRLNSMHRPRDDFTQALQGQPFQIFYQILNLGSAFPRAYQVCLYSLTEARREQALLRRSILGSSALALAAALVLSLFLSHGLTVPIGELVKGTREVARGNFGVRVPVRSGDEIGQLAASFNDMAEGLSQKERYRTVLNQVADERIAQQLISGQIKLGGELRDTTILFCDIRGFTALTRNMSPTTVIELLNEHMAALLVVVKKHNGILDKFVGDLLMVIFGAPVSHGQDALDAASCALGLLEEREKLNRTSKFQLQIGIGLASGKVVAGGMGSSERFHYTVLGERVNLASRLCDEAAPGEILLDQNTAEVLGGLAEIKKVKPLELKGFGAPVPAYQLLALNPNLTAHASK